LESLGSQEKKNTRVSENYIFSFLLIGIKDIKDLKPVRGEDGKISDTQGKDFWSPNRNLSRGCLRFFRLALLPVFDSFSH
jgi:hypothetical protein